MDSFRAVEDVAGALGDWATGTAPLHRKLTDALRRGIESGEFSPGERLPSERRLAAALAVSRTTVVAAFDALRAEGLLESRRGSGTRISTGLRPARPAPWTPGMHNQVLYQRLVDGPGPLISLTHITTEALPEVADTVREVARTDLPGLMVQGGYQPRGLPELRTAVADYYTRCGLPTAEEQIVVTTGAQQALALLAQIYLDKGSAVLVESPGIAGCLDLIRARGAELLGVPVDGEGADPEAARRVLRTRRPALMYLMPSYHNPLGVLMSPARRRRIAALAAAAEVPVLEDCAYTGLCAAAEPPPLAAFAPEGAEVLTVGSLAKVAWTGLRIGWLRAPREIAERVSRRKVLHDLGSPLLDQAVAARLLPGMERLARSRSALLEKRLAFLAQRLEEALPEWRWRRPDGGSALWVELPDSSAGVFAQVALRHGVELVPGSVAATGPSFERHFRLPFSSDIETIDEVVRRLTRAWSDLRRHGPAEESPARVVV